MAELITKLHCKKNGTIEEITAYSTLDEVQNQGIRLTIDGVDAYIKYGAIDDANASQLNCKVPNDNTEYRVHKTAVKKFKVGLTAHRNNETKMQSLTDMYITEGETFYLNNENVPTIEGYDFVMAIPNDFIVTSDTDVKVYYIPNTVPERTRTSWYYEGDLYEDSYLTDAYNTYSATALSSMWFECTIISAPKLNTSNVTSMDYMFTWCEGPFTVLPLYDTRNVTDMNRMFNGCTSLTSIPKFNTSNVTGMNRMFNGCTSLTSIPELDTSNVTNMSGMFYDCTSLTSIPELDTSNVTNMSGMFCYCTSLTSIPELDTSNVTDMERMFNGCTSLTSIPWEINMASCTNCTRMFRGCSNLNNIKLKNVSSSLDLSDIGTTNYTVVNYI